MSCGCTSSLPSACRPLNPCSIENFGLEFPSLIGPQGLPGSNLIQCGTVALATNDTSKAIVFPAAFGSIPIVNVIIVMPDNTGDVISASIDGSSITQLGFTAIFAAAIPTNTYKLTWFATPPT